MKNAIRIAFHASVATINVLAVIKDIIFIINNARNYVPCVHIYRMIRLNAWIVKRIVYSVLMQIIVCKI